MKRCAPLCTFASSQVHAPAGQQCLSLSISWLFLVEGLTMWATSLQAMAQEEADAVAALMAAASGDVRSEPEQATGGRGQSPT